MAADTIGHEAYSRCWTIREHRTWLALQIATALTNIPDECGRVVWGTLEESQVAQGQMTNREVERSLVHGKH